MQKRNERLRYPFALSLLLVVFFFFSFSHIVFAADCTRLDSNSDNKITSADLNNFSSQYSTSCTTPQFIWGCGGIDTNLDGNVNIEDFSFFATASSGVTCLRGNQWYASPSGSSSGTGSITSPWDITTALNKSSVIHGGDTLWLRGGTYGTGGSNLYTDNLAGTINAPIVIKGYPGERAIIDGGIATGISSLSRYVWYWGFEITNSFATRITTQDQRVEGLYLDTLGHNVINMVIHDAGHPAIGFWTPVGDKGVIYGNIEWGNGLFDTNTNTWRGSALYTQNQTGTRLIENNMFFSNMTTGFGAHTVSSYTNGYTLRNNTAFNNGEHDAIIYATNNPANDFLAENNTFYGFPEVNYGGVQLGLFGTQNNGIFRNNIVETGVNDLGSLRVDDWSNIQVTGNTIIGKKIVASRHNVETTSQWSNNDYYTLGTYKFDISDINFLHFSDWIKTNIDDSGSTLNATLPEPATNKIFIRPNAYEHGKGFITVYNFADDNTISADLSGMLDVGDKFVILDVMNYFGTPVYEGVYNGGSIEMPLRFYEYTPLVGTVSITHRNTAPQFVNYMVKQLKDNESYTQQVESPQFSSPTNFTTASASITLTSNTPGSSIYYTTDGSDPTISSTLYTGPISISTDTTFKTFAAKSGMLSSARLTKTYHKIDLTSNLVNEWKFEEGTGTTTANSVGGGSPSTGTLINGVSWVTGKSGKGLYFDSASSQYVSTGTISFTGSYTVSIWAKFDDEGSSVATTPLGAGSSAWLNNKFIFVWTSNSKQFNIRSADQATVTGSNNCGDPTAWQNYVGVYDSATSQQKLYCNGELMDTETLAVSPATSAVMAFGRWGSFSHGYFKGSLDEVKIYNRTFTDEEVKQLKSSY